MKTTVMMMIAMLAVPAFVTAEDVRYDDFPRMWEMRERMREQPVPEVAAEDRTPVELEHYGLTACQPLDFSKGGQIEGRTFSSKYDVEAGGKDVGVIESVSGGYVLKDENGVLIAKATEFKSGGQRHISISNCAGAPIGSIRITRSASKESWVFQIDDQEGAAIASTGWVGYLDEEISVVDGGRTTFAQLKDIHWFFDRWSVRMGPMTADGRIAAFIYVYHSEENGRVSSERRRDRDHDRGGRHDR